MKILLVNPSWKEIYESTKIKAGVPYSPVLSLAVIAAPLLEDKHEVKIIDLNLFGDPDTSFREMLEEFKPDYVGITFTTSLYSQMVKIAKLAKDFNQNVTVIGGGAHSSTFPEETLKSSSLDIAVVGEGDFTLREIVSGKDKKEIKGISYKEGDKILSNPRRDNIANLDDLPYPAWKLYQLEKYKTTGLVAKLNPAGWLETSRGCIYECPYCNKGIFGNRFRVKSPKRVVSEIEYMLDAGFKEIHIADDCFSTDLKRAKDICDGIIEKGLKFPWSTLTGIRVDKVDEELLEKMAKAGCYRVYFGIESGSQKVLDSIHKKFKLDQAEKAVKLAKKAGMEVYGFFMIGLPDEEEEDMKKTIEFAKKLDLDIVKMSITIPIPGSPLFNDLNKSGLIKTKDWSKFNLYAIPEDIYDHPRLSWEIINKYYNKFYRAFYFRPGFIFKRFMKGLLSGTMLDDIKHFFQTKW
ncbi:MAG: hypothetical protein A2297_05005 [Elusimicrobia bacterium RIFOXYB2_FULL_48_7]|nr:MAG: hypothetical protein A2297_05005 [Elusimicrobia bacterium RIFOXYB2_FULL_48_7]